MTPEIERLTKERDVAQSTCTAWQSVYEGIEAHLQDRINCRDQANPELYLEIIRADVARVLEHSKQICASRWHDAAASRQENERLRTTLKWALPLAELAIEGHRQERLRCGHGDIKGTYKSGVTYAGIYQTEIDKIEAAREISGS